MLVIRFWTATLCVGSVAAVLTVYPQPQGIAPSNKFQVTVSQGGQSLNSFVYISMSDARSQEVDHVQPGRSVSWTSFAFSGQPVTVEVTAPRDFRKCKVRPKRYGIRCRRSGSKKAQFTLTASNRFMSVEFNYDYGSQNVEIKDKMLVFADSPETNVPDPNARDVLYFGPGQHDLRGQKELDGSIKEVYLAPGSYVHGGFITTGDRAVKIHGRGVVSGEKYAFRDSRFQWAMINVDRSNDNIVEGITMANTLRFFYRGLRENNVVRGLKMVGAWTFNSDGVAIGPSGLVEDCFIMANDDSLKMTHDSVTIRRIVVWQMRNGAVFQTGWWASRSMKSVRVNEIDVIHIDWCVDKGPDCHTSQNNAVFDLAKGTSFINVSDVEFKDVRIEGSCPRLIYFKLQPGAEGRVSNIRFLNWRVESQPTNDQLRNEISGTSQGRVTDWTFRNLRVGRNCVSNASDGDFVIDSATTSGIRFRCRSGRRRG